MDNKRPRISIVITNYNKGKFIDRAIRSCLSQLVIQRIIEVIVVDDCSTDNSMQILEEFSSSIKIIKNSKNRGVSYASNVGLSHSNGDYWMRVDADDYLSINACEIMSSILDSNREISYVYADHYRINVNGFKESRIHLNNRKALYEHGAGVLMRTEMLRSIGGYDENLRNCEDYDLLYRINKSGYKGFYLPIPLYRYYIHGDNITLTPEREKFRKVVNMKHGI